MINLIYAPEIKAEDADFSVLANDISCNGKRDGSIEITTPEKNSESFIIEIKDKSSQILAQFSENSPKPFRIGNLKAGNYTLFYSSGEKTDSLSIKIKDPDIFKAGIISIENVSGENETLRASIKANALGGTPPYSVIWSENTGNKSGAIVNDLPMGVYRCTINDSNNCGEVTATIFLYESEIEKFKNKTTK